MKTQKNLLVKMLIAIVLFSSISTANAEETVKLKRHFVFDTVQPDLKQQVDTAEYGLDGQITKVTTGKLDNGVNYLGYEVKVNEWLKGKDVWVKNGNDPSVFKFKVWAETKSAFKLEPGENFVALFHPFSELGLTSPVAVGVGLYKVLNKSGEGFTAKKVAINKDSNIGTIRNLKTREYINIKNSALLQEAKEYDGKEMPVNTLKAVIKDLASQ